MLAALSPRPQGALLVLPRFGRSVILSMGVIAVAGCSTPSARLDQALPDRFIHATDAAPAEAGAWWQRFDDPLLARLVDDALHAGHDLRIAAARVEAARAGLKAAGGALLPAVSAVGARSIEETGYPESTRQRLPDTDVVRAGAGLSWEIDLFGALRAARGAAAADLQATEHARHGVQISVAAEVARQYITLRGAQERAAIVRALVQSQRETLRLTESRRAAGQGSDFDVDRARGELAATQSELPRLEALAAATRHRLATLTGRPAGALDAVLEAAPEAAPAQRPSALAVPAIATGQPMELLQRRPDLLAAEAQLRGAGRRLDEARANRFPRLVLSALFGTQWTDLNLLDLGRARFANVGATLSMPIFAGGRINAAIDAAGAREREALAVYERSVLQALEDVDSALALLAAESRRSADLDQSVGARERSLGRARALYRAGQADLLVVLDVERGLLAAQLARATHRTDHLLAAVQLYRALGGGWQVKSAGQGTGAAASDARASGAPAAANAPPVAAREAG